MKSEPPPCSAKLAFILTLLRIAIGWHFLYEGLAKLLDPQWTAAGYLQNSTGFLSQAFRYLAGNPDLLRAVDILNIVGLIGIGLVLFLGIGTRLAATAGVLLLSLYYLAMPPWPGTSVGQASEGHYLLVNKNLLEILALCALAAIPGAWTYGLGHLRRKVGTVARETAVQVPDEMNHYPEHAGAGRREVLKNLISLPFFGGFIFAFAKNHGWQSFEEANLLSRGVKPGGKPGAPEGVDAVVGATIKVGKAVALSDLKEPVAKGKIAGTEISRLICGGNLIGGWAHSRDLIYMSRFLREYHTEKKLLETLWLCEQCGINTAGLNMRPEEIAILQKFWKLGGKMQWIPQMCFDDLTNFRAEVTRAADMGAIGAQIQGNVGDFLVKHGKADVLGEMLEWIKEKGLIAGVAGHELATIQAVESAGMPADFYQKTIHPTNYWSWQPDQPKDKMVIDNYDTDNYWCRDQAETIAFFAKCEKPWVAFKVLAAGAIAPPQGFRYAFENGADFAMVGMFDFQLVENANHFTRVVGHQSFNRNRPWRA
jgi:uncharacterized membrane protein YphA (DoxX/SURF4 family)